MYYRQGPCDCGCRKRKEGIRRKANQQAVRGTDQDRKNILAQQGDSKFVRITLDDTGNYHDQAISTIICEGDAIGAVVLYEKNETAKMGETESKLAITAAGFLGRQMEQ